MKRLHLNENDSAETSPWYASVQIPFCPLSSDLNLRHGERRSRNRDSNVEQVTPRARSQSTNGRNSGEGARSSSVPPPQERGGSEEGNRQQQGGPGIQYEFLLPFNFIESE